MKTFDKYRISSASMRHVYGGTQSAGPVIDPVEGLCGSYCDVCYHVARNFFPYCCNCRVD
jgi:hypothetical protein